MYVHVVCVCLLKYVYLYVNVYVLFLPVCINIWVSYHMIGDCILLHDTVVDFVVSPSLKGQSWGDHHILWHGNQESMK